MRKIVSLVLFFLLTLVAGAQKATAKNALPLDPTKLTMADMQRLAKMSPEEQAAYKAAMLKSAETQLKQLAKAGNIQLDETLLPTSKISPPVKDMVRLAGLPKQPPTRQELLSATSKMEAALKSIMPAPAVQQAEQFAATKSVKEIRGAAIGGWYDQNPAGALLLGMKAVQKDPADILGWNNLAALCNLAGLQHKAVPILQHCLQQEPNSSLLLNNMGQAYLGMGELQQARLFLEKCLAFDELNPEANHSMALIHLFQDETEKALQYFAKELEVGQRRSTLAQLVKSGKRSQINLSALRKKKMKLDGTDNRDFFEEINLGKFKLPDPPMKSAESARWKAETAPLLQSITEELLFWQHAGQATEAQLREEGKLYPGLYHDLVNELIRDLGDKYIPLLGIVEEDDVPFLQGLHNTYAKRDRETECPSPPLDAENFAILNAAYQKKCCDLKTPLIDELMYKYNSFISSKVVEAQSNYKQYINGLIGIAQLDPSPGNRRLVYASVSHYFTFLTQCIQAFLVKDPYMSCPPDLTSAQADAIIQSKRNVDLNCPSWLKLNVSLKVAKLKADCQAFQIEADVYKLIQVGAEKNFKTGTSTLYAGAGIDGKFKGVASGEIKQEFYIVFDHNNQFADLGMRGGASGDLASGMIGAEFGYDFSLNSGFNAQGEVKSTWVTNYEKALNYVAK